MSKYFDSSANQLSELAGRLIQVATPNVALPSKQAHNSVAVPAKLQAGAEMPHATILLTDRVDADRDAAAPGDIEIGHISAAGQLLLFHSASCSGPTAIMLTGYRLPHANIVPASIIDGVNLSRSNTSRRSATTSEISSRSRVHQEYQVWVAMRHALKDRTRMSNLSGVER